MKPRSNFLRYLSEQYDYVSNTASSVLSVILSIFASVLYDKLKSGNRTPADSFICFFLVLTVLILILIISFASNKIKRLLSGDDKQNRSIQEAYFSIQSLSMESQRLLQEQYGDRNSGNIYKWYLDTIQLAVDKCYDFFYNSFGQRDKLIDETKFEVTYMTLSYIDNEITIPCSCNKEKRTPTSMLNRKNNPQIYNKTVTAEVYEEYHTHKKPSFRIIEDTQSSHSNYKPIYANQTDRIRSSVVLPIVSHKNELLGTLVVHCNTPFFFKEIQRDFWYEILQLFASEIGKYKLLLDKSEKPDDLF